MKPLIYALCEPDSETIRYIGQTIDIDTRLTSHYKPSNLINKSHKNLWLKSLLAKSKKANVIILYEADSTEDLDQLEIMWIANYQILGCNLTNGTSGGDNGFRGGKHSEESKKKIRSAMRGSSHSRMTEEIKMKISLSQKGKPRWSAAQKEKISLFQRNRIGVSCSEESKLKIGAANKGKRRSEETKHKMSESRKGRPGKALSEETKQKISKVNKGKTWKLIDGKRVWINENH